MVDLVKLATVLDWITPTVALYRNLMAGDAEMLIMEEGGDTGRCAVRRGAVGYGKAGKWNYC